MMFLARLLRRGCRPQLLCMCDELGGLENQRSASADINSDAVDILHKWEVECFCFPPANQSHVCTKAQLLRIPKVRRLLAQEGHLRVVAITAGQLHHRDRDGNVPGIYQVDDDALRAIVKIFQHTLSRKLWLGAQVPGDGVEDAKPRTQNSYGKSCPVRPTHKAIPLHQG